MARLQSSRVSFAIAVLALYLSAFPIFVSALQDQQVNPPPAVPNHNDSPADLEKQGDALRAEKHYLDSIDFYNVAMSKQPSAMLWNKEGMAYLFLQRFPDAAKCFDRAIRLDKHAPEGYNNRGYVEQRKQHYSKAARYYKKAMSLRPDDAIFHYNLGSTYFSQHEYPKAESELRTAYTLDPTIFLRVSRIGFMAQSSSPQDRAAYSFMLARMYAQAGDVDHSIQYLRKAMEEGYKDMKKVYTDSEFATLRTDKRFEDLMAQRPQPLQ